jgi:hypothetical protein
MEIYNTPFRIEQSISLNDTCCKTILPFYIKNECSDTYDCIKLPEYKNEYDKSFTHIYNYEVDAYDYSTINWGCIVWEFLHTITFKIKDELFESFKVELLSKIQYILKIMPCNMCLRHIHEYFEKTPLVVNTKTDLILALYNFHNNVNNETEKPIFSYTDFCEKYENINLFYTFNNFLYILELYHITNYEKYEIQNWLSSNVEYFIHC